MNKPLPSKSVPGADGAENPLIPFEPVPVRPRRDGWTVEKQIAFIEALAETGIVEEACRRVGMSRTSADNLRRRPCGVHFRRAWEAALDYSLYRVEEDASIVISVWSRDPPFLLEPTKAGRPRIKSGVTGAR